MAYLINGNLMPTYMGSLSPAAYLLLQNPVSIQRRGVNGMGAIDFSLGGSAVGGVPNILLYGGAVLIGYWWLFGGHKSRRSRKALEEASA